MQGPFKTDFRLVFMDNINVTRDIAVPPQYWLDNDQPETSTNAVLRSNLEPDTWGYCEIKRRSNARARTHRGGWRGVRVQIRFTGADLLDSDRVWHTAVILGDKSPQDWTTFARNTRMAIARIRAEENSNKT